MICMLSLRNNGSSTITGKHVNILGTSLSQFICKYKQLFETDYKLKKGSG